ncbi:MAG: hypothetical protein ACRC14_08235 [Paracoccaceae bacterium]
MSNIERELILHIGQPKTGSSFLQSALAGSVEPLAAQGVVYPIDATAALRSAKGVINTGNFRYSIGTLQALLDTPITRDAKRILFSNEAMFLILRRQGDLFLDEIEALVPKVRLSIILYIRDPVDHAISMYHQRIKNGSSSDNFSDSMVSYSYPLLVKFLLTLFEARRVPVIVRNYSRHSKSLIQSFEDCLQVPAGTLVAPEAETVNRSLTLAELELQRSFNRHLGVEGRKFVSHPLCNHLPDIPSETPPLPEAEIAAFLGRMTALLRRPVFAKYIPEAEAYRVGEVSDHLARFSAHAPDAPLTFTREQLDVVVDAICARLKADLREED